jgi:hypothetical protein
MNMNPMGLGTPTPNYQQPNSSNPAVAVPTVAVGQDTLGASSIVKYTQPADTKRSFPGNAPGAAINPNNPLGC